jgi:hypothetical protein
VAFHFDISPVEQGNVADNGEAKARAAGFAAAAFIRAVKPFKDAVYMFGGDADAFVFYLNNKLFTFLKSVNINQGIIA